MESSTATNSSFPAKLLLVIQVQWVVWMLYWMHSQKHHSTGTRVHCSCLTIKDFAVQAETVAVETSIDVVNILWISYDCLCQCFSERPPNADYTVQLTSHVTLTLWLFFVRNRFWNQNRLSLAASDPIIDSGSIFLNFRVHGVYQSNTACL